MKYGAEGISCLVPKILSIVPEIINHSDSVESFKLGKLKWKPECPCRLCKTYLKHLKHVA